MKKIWLLTTLLVGGLLLTGCDTNEQKTIEQNSSILTWGFSEIQDNENKIEEPIEETINENIPLCNDIDLNRNTKYTYIDNVVENCTYEEWTAYSWNWGWCWWVMPHLYITKDIIWYFDIVADEISFFAKEPSEKYEKYQRQGSKYNG